MKLRNDDRAVSATITYVLTVAITTVLVSGLIVTAGSVVEDQRRSALHDELGVVGERIAAEFTSADRLVQGGDDPAVRLQTDHPRRLVGERYTVELKTGSEPPCTRSQCLVMNASDVTVTVPFTTRTAVRPGAVQGGRVVVRYDRTNGTLVLEGP